MGFEFKDNKKIIEICGVSYEYKTNVQTQQARADIIERMEIVKKLKNQFAAIQEMIVSMCDFIEDTLGSGSVDSIFGIDAKMKADFNSLLDLTIFIIEETATLEKATFKQYDTAPDRDLENETV